MGDYVKNKNKIIMNATYIKVNTDLRSNIYGLYGHPIKTKI
jgi:hypothetical protein